MPRVIFTTQVLVWVHIKGELNYTPPKESEPNLPECRDVGDLVQKFLEFQVREGIYPVQGTGGSSGGGEYSGFFIRSDALKVEAWLHEQGAECQN
jgi:hypothetical protein